MRCRATWITPPCVTTRTSPCSWRPRMESSSALTLLSNRFSPSPSGTTSHLGSLVHSAHASGNLCSISAVFKPPLTEVDLAQGQRLGPARRPLPRRSAGPSPARASGHSCKRQRSDAPPIAAEPLSLASAYFGKRGIELALNPMLAIPRRLAVADSNNRLARLWGRGSSGGSGRQNLILISILAFLSPSIGVGPVSGDAIAVTRHARRHPLRSLLESAQGERSTGTLTLRNGNGESTALYFLFGHLFHAEGDGRRATTRSSARWPGRKGSSTSTPRPSCRLTKPSRPAFPSWCKRAESAPKAGPAPAPEPEPAPMQGSNTEAHTERRDHPETGEEGGSTPAETRREAQTTAEARARADPCPGRPGHLRLPQDLLRRFPRLITTLEKEGYTGYVAS